MLENADFSGSGRRTGVKGMEVRNLLNESRIRTAQRHGIKGKIAQSKAREFYHRSSL